MGPMEFEWILEVASTCMKVCEASMEAVMTSMELCSPSGYVATEWPSLFLAQV